MFWLKIIQRFEGYKKCPFKRYFPDHGGIPYTYSFSQTYSFKKSFCLFCKREFFVDEILRNILCLLLHMEIGSVSDIALH